MQGTRDTPFRSINNSAAGYQHGYRHFFNSIFEEMLISSTSTSLLRESIAERRETYCSGLYLSARWFVFSQAAGSGTHVILMPTKEAAEYCAADLYNLIEGDRVFYLPSSGRGIERSNYKSSLGVQRTAAVGKILEGKGDFNVFVTFPEALEEKIPDPSSIRNSILVLKQGDEIPYGGLKEKLAENGFEKVDFVSAPGQFAFRGSVVDIFSYSSSDPYRLSFWGDEIEEIHTFDCNTQLSKEKCGSVEIISSIVSEGEGESLVEIASVLPEDALLWLDSSDMYSHKEFFLGFHRFRKVYIDTPISCTVSERIIFSISPQPVFNKNFEILTADIRSRMENKYKVYIYGEKESQLGRLRSILLQNGGIVPEFVAGKNIHNGFIDSENKVCCYSDHEIFDRFHRVSLRRTVDKSEQLTLNDLSAFNVGDYVVHIDHGVGIFGGLVRMRDDMGRVKEVVKLTYKDGDVVFVSVHALNKISRYKPREGEAPKINKLGSKSWQTLKYNAKSRVKDIAKDLIQLYAKRRASKGFAFSPDSYLQEELESSFMYEDTPDQELATIAVKQDMEDTCPMDRLVCGDVGFGKTEVAIRAAFKAAADSKQVAVLVPTTILALQHFTTFTARLKDLPCTVDYVSRLRTEREIKKIQEKVKQGQIDILIGTHKILGKGFEFKDLGLLIIDEEQIF